MQEKVVDFCRRYEIEPAEDPQLLPYSRKAWIVGDVTGRQWVVKSRASRDKTAEVLRSLPFLHPPFTYPEPVSGPEDAYLLYPYIQADPLADGAFEDATVVETVREVIGRMQALMRSLVLVPFYKETLNLKEPEADPIRQLQDRSGWDNVRSMDSRRKEERQQEITRSYRWTEAKVREWSKVITSLGLWPGSPLNEYVESVSKSFPLHVPVAGSNLAHTALHPEHVLVCPDGHMGIVGWQVESRPRFYMTYTYLSWCFLHSLMPDPSEHYGRILIRNSSKAFSKEHHQVFALCLMEQLVRHCQTPGTNGLQLPPDRVEKAQALFTLCVDNLGRQEKEIAEF